MRLLDRINRTGTTVVVATHDAGIVDQMRRRVIELDHGPLVRDQARGVYGMAPDAPEDAPAGDMSAGLLRLCRPRDGVEPVAQPAHDHRRGAHRGGVAVARGRGRCCCARASPMPRTQWAHGVDVIVWIKPTSPRPARRGRAPRSSSSLCPDHHLPVPGLGPQRGACTCSAAGVRGADARTTMPASLRIQLDNPSEALAIARSSTRYARGEERGRAHRDDPQHPDRQPHLAVGLRRAGASSCCCQRRC